MFTYKQMFGIMYTNKCSYGGVLWSAKLVSAID